MTKLRLGDEETKREKGREQAFALSKKKSISIVMLRSFSATRKNFRFRILRTGQEKEFKELTTTIRRVHPKRNSSSTNCKEWNLVATMRSA
jgi:hypothetical protein